MPCKFCRDLCDILPCSPDYSDEHKLKYIEEAHSVYNAAQYRILMKNCVCKTCHIKLICLEICDDFDELKLRKEALDEVKRLMKV